MTALIILLTLATAAVHQGCFREDPAQGLLNVPGRRLKAGWDNHDRSRVVNAT